MTMPPPERGRAARFVAPGLSWIFTEHRSMAEVMRDEARGTRHQQRLQVVRLIRDRLAEPLGEAEPA